MLCIKPDGLLMTKYRYIVSKFLNTLVVRFSEYYTSKCPLIAFHFLHIEWHVAETCMTCLWGQVDWKFHQGFILRQNLMIQTRRVPNKSEKLKKTKRKRHADFIFQKCLERHGTLRSFLARLNASCLEMYGRFLCTVWSLSTVLTFQQ